MGGAVMDQDRKYYHGGPRGIWPRKILPPEITDAPSTAEFGAHGICRRDRVYVTTSYEAAQVFASFCPGGRGAVYEVLPIGELEDDPDCTVPGLSYCCRAARIVRSTDVRAAT